MASNRPWATWHRADISDSDGNGRSTRLTDLDPGRGERAGSDAVFPTGDLEWAGRRDQDWPVEGGRGGPVVAGHANGESPPLATSGYPVEHPRPEATSSGELEEALPLVDRLVVVVESPRIEASEPESLGAECESPQGPGERRSESRV